MEVRKRMRNTASKRWTREEKNLLLEVILENPQKFEKPTARIYYTNIIKNHQEFVEFGWKAMRDKMRNLRASYTKAIIDLHNNDSGLNEEDTEVSMREYKLKICEDFDKLHNIYTSKNYVSMFPHYTADQSSTSTPSEVEVKGENYQSVQPEEEYVNHVLVDHPEEMQILAEIQKDKTAYLRDKLDSIKSTEEKKFKLEEKKFILEEKKFKLEEELFALEKEKLALEREKMKEHTRLRELEERNNFELNKLRLEKEMALKELELNYKYNK